MSDTLIKPKLGIINPYWKRNPVFRDIAICLPFLEGDGDVTKDLVGPNGLTDMATAVWGADTVGPCIVLNEDTNLSTKTVTDDYIWDNITFSYWATTTSSNTSSEYLMRIDAGGGNYIRFGKNNVQGFVAVSKADNGTQRYNYKSTPDCIDGYSHHWVFMADKVGTYIYYDGQLYDFDGPMSSGNGDQNGWTVGGDGSNGWRGRIDSVSIWKRALSANEIYELYRLGPTLRLNDRLRWPLFTAALPEVPTFNAAFACNSNQIL